MNTSSCPSSKVADFDKLMAGIPQKMVRVNGLTLANAVLAGILVAIGNYGTSYRHRAFVGALFLGANTLFLPILSYVASNAASTAVSPTLTETETQYIVSFCDASFHLFLVLIWAGLVHIVGIDTCTMVAASKREGRIIGLPMVLLVQAIWSSYLVVSSFMSSLLRTPDTNYDPTIALLPITFALIFSKIVFKYYAFQKARHSFAFGRNPPLIVGYMKQLRGRSKYGGIPPPVEHCPPLIVMGEDRDEVDKGAHGFFFKSLCHNQDASMTSGTGLVTMDKVWQFNDDDTGLKSSTTWRLKQVCLSFTLFKLLRCRFAGYTVAEAGFQQVRDFFMHVLLKDKDHERVHDMITDELSFLHDYYYSSIPIHYSNFWLPIVSICISLLTISHCLLLAGMGGYSFSENDLVQVYCELWCSTKHTSQDSDDKEVSFGNLVYDVVPVAILLVSVVLAEAREIASYICSNWTKVALFGGYVVNNHDAWQRSPRMQKWIRRVLQRRSKKLMTHWDDKMYQCSVLVMHPRRRTDPVISLVMRLLRLPDRKKNVKVPGVLKARIFSVLTSNNGLLTDPKTFLCQSLSQEDVGSDDFLWACETEGISDLLLMWHIATSILEVRQGQHSPPLSEDMIVATHLSRYCAYLVAYVPELLPDDDEWCKSLYKAVKKDSMLALDDGVAAPLTTEEAYNRLVALLEKADHVVMKKGVKLGKQLVELQQRREQATWRFLAGFWSGMILYVAPSNNLKGHAAPSENLKAHAEAIARGGELITLVWALLMNVGIDSRPSSTEASTATVEDV